MQLALLGCFCHLLSRFKQGRNPSTLHAVLGQARKPKSKLKLVGGFTPWKVAEKLFPALRSGINRTSPLRPKRRRRKPPDISEHKPIYPPNLIKTDGDRRFRIEKRSGGGQSTVAIREPPPIEIDRHSHRTTTAYTAYRT